MPHDHVRKPIGFATRAIHQGYDPLAHQGALNPPVYMSSTFAFESAEHGGRLFAGEEKGYFYSRVGAVRGHAVAPLGVNAFGQCGDTIDLYRHYQIDSQAIMAAAVRFGD